MSQFYRCYSFLAFLEKHCYIGVESIDCYNYSYFFNCINSLIFDETSCWNRTIILHTQPNDSAHVSINNMWSYIHVVSFFNEKYSFPYSSNTLFFAEISHLCFVVFEIYRCNIDCMQQIKNKMYVSGMLNRVFYVACKTQDIHVFACKTWDISQLFQLLHSKILGHFLAKLGTVPSFGLQMCGQIANVPAEFQDTC